VQAQADAIEDKLAKAQSVLDATIEDPEVKAAQSLLLRTGQEFTLLEQQRLLEFHRHLITLQRIQADQQSRNDEYMDNLMLPAMAALDLDTADRLWSERMGMTLGTEERRTLATHIAKWQDSRGRPRTFPEYLESCLARGSVKAHGQKAVELVQNLALILFVEQDQDYQASLDVATEQHRHSINLSKINLAEQMHLVHQTTEALQIYYQGGVKPEQVAELIIMSSQVAALFYIGARI
jgi:hypothetical protein